MTGYTRMTGYTPIEGPVLPEQGARIAICPERVEHRSRACLRVIEAKRAKQWRAVFGSRHAAVDLAMREGWTLDATGEACA